MFSFLKKKKIVPHIKLSGVIGNVGKFKQGIDFSGQEEIISKAYKKKKPLNENSKRNPINFYGYSKLLAEEIIEKSNCNYLKLDPSQSLLYQ